MAVEAAHGNEQARGPSQAPPALAVTRRQVEARNLSAEVYAQLRYKVLGKGRTPCKGKRAVLSAEHLGIRQAALTQRLTMGWG
jgi:hypothetical protein